MATITFTKDHGRQRVITANVLLDAADNELVQDGVAIDTAELIDLPVGAIVVAASVRVEETGTGAATGGTAVAMTSFTADLQIGGTSILTAALDLTDAAGVSVAEDPLALPVALTAKDTIDLVIVADEDAGGGVTATGKFRVVVSYAIDGRASDVQP